MSVLILSQNGAYSNPGLTLAQAAVSPQLVGKTIVVTSPQEVSTSIAWPDDRELRFKKGGYVTFGVGGSLTGLKETRPEYFGVNATPGTTDMTEAFTRALQSMQVGGGTLLLDSTIYLVGLNANWANGSASGWLDSAGRTYAVSFSIRGNGPTSIIKAKTGTGYAMQFNTALGGSVTNTDYNKRWITVENVAIDANGEPYGIKILNSPGIRVRNSSLYGMTAAGADSANSEVTGGLYIQGSGMFRFDNLAIRPEASAVGLNINIDAGDGTISGCDIAAGYTGVLFANATGNHKVFNNTIYNQLGYGIKFTGSTNNTHQMNIFANQFAEAGVAMVDVFSDATTKYATALNISNNTFWINGSDGDGLVIGRANEFNVSNNVFPWIGSGVGNGKFAIKTISTANGSITNNTIKRIETGGTGIQVAGSRIDVAGNTLYDMSDSTASSFLVLSGNPDMNSISGNMLRQYSLVAAYALRITGAPTTLYIGDNNFASGLITAYTNAYRSELSFKGAYAYSGWKLHNSAWDNNPFRLGENIRIWPSPTGNTLYLKNGAPSSGGDGDLIARKTAVPANATTAGFPGQWASDTSYHYTYTGDGVTHTWRRVAHVVW